MFLFLVEKGAPKDCWHEIRSSLKCTPPPPPRAEKAAYAPVCQPLLLMLALVSYIIHLVNTLFFISMTMSMKLMEGGSDIIYFRVDQMNSVLIPHQSYPCRPLLLTVTDWILSQISPRYPLTLLYFLLFKPRLSSTAWCPSFPQPP